MKSLPKLSLFSSRVASFCAFCRKGRKTYRAKNIGFVHVVSAILMTCPITFLIWGEADGRAFLLLTIFLLSFEFCIHMRWRISMACPHCGFDPLIYKKNPSRAASLVASFIQRRGENSRYLLATPLNLPKRWIEKPKNLIVKSKPSQVESPLI